MTETPSCSIKSSSSDDDDDDQTNTMHTLLKVLTQSLGSFSCFSLFLDSLVFILFHTGVFFSSFFFSPNNMSVPPPLPEDLEEKGVLGGTFKKKEEDEEVAVAADKAVPTKETKALPKALLERLKKKGIVPAVVVPKEEDKEEKNDEEENVPPPPLPKGWREGKSEDYDNHAYYYNAKLNISRCTRPKEKKTKKEKEKVPPFYWKTTVDKKTKREYYYNEKTNYCTWVMPEDPAIVAKMIRCANCGGFGQGLVKEHGFCNHCARELRVRKKPPPTKQRGGGQKKTLVL